MKQKTAPPSPIYQSVFPFSQSIRPRLLLLGSREQRPKHVVLGCLFPGGATFAAPAAPIQGAGGRSDPLYVEESNGLPRLARYCLFLDHTTVVSVFLLFSLLAL
ncbi:hypothetical protein CEXT_512361 [Caerostris extrusa]|uniref:Uncharacterized protein n=1 Tax=Caerostris extrusa TaxID=172846 RepID=A0AAV4TAT0_CAEEX|nr:hypothetical protein CEXT_512361 [Caerostris extrusa]